MSITESFQQLLQRVRERPRHPVRVTGLAGLGIAHAVLATGRALSKTVVVVPRPGGTEELLRDLRFLAGEQGARRIAAVPQDDRTPYHATSPDPLLVMERMATLHKIATGFPLDVLVLPPEALTRRTLPFGRLQAMAEQLEKGQELDRQGLLKKLVVGGYTAVNTVEDPGSYAVRGSIIDIFWPGAERPLRIDLFGDTIESLKLFAPDTQRTVSEVESFSFGPAREVHLDHHTVSLATRRLRDLADAVEFPTKKLRELLVDLENHIPVFGVEGLLPAFYDTLETPLQLAARAWGHDGFVAFIDEPDAAYGAAAAAEKDFLEHHRLAVVRGDLCFPTDAFLQSRDDLDAALSAVTRVELKGLVVENEGPILEVRTRPTADLRQDILRESTRVDGGGDSAHSVLLPFVKRILDLRSRQLTVLLPAATLGGLERMKELLRAHRLEVRALKEPLDLMSLDARTLSDPSVHAWAWVARPSDPARGAELPHVGGGAGGVAVIAEEEVFGKRARRGSSAGRGGGFKTTLADLREGDFIVHVEHGVGAFVGLTRLNVRGVEQDYLLLHYDGGDKLYLPVHRINLVQKYQGSGARPPRLDKLGGTGWETTKKKVKAAVIAMAQDLLALYAKRELAKREMHAAPDEAYWEFEAAFPFETTPDQQKAIDDVIADMQRDRPMDRLICGDVGYGKTEVGMRGAMIAVAGGRQVAVLAPTTVLAQQHYQTFTERFKGTPAVIEVVSRFKKPAEVKDALQRAKDGKVDVLIGTHRLLSSDVSFKNLGLILVDEEQRFGVKSKETLKRWKTNVDVLTLTATPIPRTLQMGFFGVRDMSVIETAPVDRRAIRTSIIKFDDEVIREAMVRELSRGGQVYFVHNRVRSIQATADYLKRLVPEARIGIGHGQMGEDELEEVMFKFMKHELNVLVCTAIIETGIDVPTANTMFIDHAEDFGLAQLYQLRGRVGRSKERAFAYLLIPGATESLHPDARARLEVLQRFTDLGAGFQVAQHDLELRGAGDLLGKSQHGHVTAVGYDLYTELLKEAVEDLRGQAHDDAPDPDINLPIAAFIPEKYIVDMHERLSVYQRLATAKESKDLYDIVGALSDQYGDAPAEVTALADVMALKMRLREMYARALEASFEAAPKPPPPPPEPKPSIRPGASLQERMKHRAAEKKAPAKVAPAPAAPPTPPVLVPRIVVTLGDKARLDAEKLMAFCAQDPTRARFTPQLKLVYTPTEQDWQRAGCDLVAVCRDFLRRVQEAAGTKGPPPKAQATPGIPQPRA